MPRRWPLDLKPGAHTERLATTAVGVPDPARKEIAEIVGAERVSSDDDVLVDSARDWWPLSGVWAAQGRVVHRPAAVVTPTTTEEVAGVLSVASHHGIPVTPAAGRSGVGGGAVPVCGGIVLDCTGLDRTGLDTAIDVDETSMLVTTGPGVFGDVFEAALREKGYTLGHWPQSIDISTVGGWLACRGAGQFSTRYGKIEDMVAGLEVVLASGRTLRTGGAPRAAVGPDLNQVFVGSEGAFGVITEATLRIHPAPKTEQREAWTLPSFEDGLDACRRILRRGATPAVLRLYDSHESRQTYDVDGCVLLALDEGDAAIVSASMAIAAEECDRTDGAAGADPALVEQWLGHRNDVSALGAAIEAGVVVDTVEVSGNWSDLPRIYSDVLAAVGGVEGTVVVSAHCSHSYTDGGCLYFTFAGMVGDDPDDKDHYYVAAFNGAVEAARGAGAAISHHHGVGINRAPFVRDALGPDAFDVLVGLKNTLDPAGILNPGALGLPSPFLPDGWTWS
ncbi:MAG: FAD-binding oxidoreductase [Acidimicrobiia bacterium]|nr:FAD-binding oxidoreductase [Acidimicrobiia bacterium]